MPISTASNESWNILLHLSPLLLQRIPQIRQSHYLVSLRLKTGPMPWPLWITVHLLSMVIKIIETTVVAHRDMPCIVWSMSVQDVVIVRRDRFSIIIIHRRLVLDIVVQGILFRLFNGKALVVAVVAAIAVVIAIVAVRFAAIAVAFIAPLRAGCR
jgi:hypothetical protein